MKKKESLVTPCTVEMAASAADQKEIANIEKIITANNTFILCI